MPSTTKLNELQLVLLAHAVKTSDGSMFPLPDTVSGPDRIQKELKALLRRGLIVEAKTTDRAASWRQVGEVHFGLFLTKQGTEALALAAREESTIAGPADGAQPAAPALREARPGSKIANVLGLLRRTQGATLAELVGATGWLPHTTRAALTGLKKKGHAIAKTKRDEVTCYQIAGAR